MDSHPTPTNISAIGRSAVQRPWVVLTVDDDPEIRRALERHLRHFFDKVLSAANEQEAETHLGAHRVTHIVCDYFLGEGRPVGTFLVARWRREHQNIGRAVLYTEYHLDFESTPNAIDAIIDKSQSVETLLQALDVKAR